MLFVSGRECTLQHVPVVPQRARALLHLQHLVEPPLEVSVEMLDGAIEVR